MGWTRDEVVEGIEGWICDLEEVEGSPIIIVEGKRDIRSLKDLGITVPCMHLNKGLSMVSFVESMVSLSGPFAGHSTYDKVIILTDWDRKGYYLSSLLTEACASLQVTYDTDFRRRISILTSKWIKDVESLSSLLENLKGGKSSFVIEHPDPGAFGP